MVVQHSMVGRSSQCTSVMPPASPVAFITRVNAGTLASNVGTVMNIFMLDWPPATARPTSARMSALGCTITVWKNTSAIACSATSAVSRRTRSAMLSHGNTKAMLPSVVTPPASAAREPVM